MLLFGSVAVSASAAPTSAAVCIEHLGYTNKLILPIVLSDSATLAKECSQDAKDRTDTAALWYDIIPRANMAGVLKTVMSVKSDVDMQRRAFGDFAFVILADHHTNVVSFDRSVATELLERLKRYCGTDGRCRRQIAQVVTQLSLSPDKPPTLKQ
jgi:hypothetical protein